MEDGVMSSINWGDYEIFKPAVYGLPEQLSRADARKNYDQWIAQKSQRIEQLHRLLELNGFQLDTSDEKIQQLNDWFIDHVEPNPKPTPEMAGALDGLWYSVAFDIAAFLGDVMIERDPRLYWHLFVPRNPKYVGYQNHVIHGFTYGLGKIQPNACYDLDGIVTGVGQGAVMGEIGNSRTTFVGVLAGARNKMQKQEMPSVL
ncbi:hypothetical protein BKG83_24435 [Mycobacteroides chelonae]|nr:hypothetical protein BKG83_24435 [Mycobacteroides chelonae]PKQ57813.1 hypothetical protein B5566_11630 [Mycobacterium sp. MHSD3]